MKTTAKAVPRAPGLREYRRKRRFAATPEPPPQRPQLAVVPPPARAGRRFCVQEHHATQLHYDLRLEINGVLKSWAIPRGPSLDPEVRRLALATEDHPLEYLDFEGSIPAGNYGAGEVIVWDTGEFEPVGDTPPLRQWEQGQIKFRLRGRKLHGEFALIYTPPRPGAAQPGEKQAGADNNTWLLIKKRDAAARFGDTAAGHPGSVLRPPGRAAARAPGAAGPQLVPQPAAETPVRPMLATLAAEPFRDPAWLFEIKWDGVRALAQVRHGQVRLVSRTSRNLSPQYPELAYFPTAPGEQKRGARPSRAGARARPFNAVLDGEIVALDADGQPSFHRLQRRMNLTGTAAIERLSAQVPVVFYAFDLLALGGRDLTRLPLRERKRRLAALAWAGPWRYSDHVVGDGVGLFELARQRGLEGIVGKRADSPYEAGRSRHWLKFKLQQRQEAVIVGYTDPRSSRTGFGALLLAVFEPRENALVSIGRVGTGFDAATRADLLRRFRPAGQPPALGLPAHVHWVQPEWVAEVKFAEWTSAGQMRAPVYLGLRPDKTPRDCRREVPDA